MPLAFVSYVFGAVAERYGFAPIYVSLIAGAVAILVIAIFKLLKRHEIDANN
jgi:fucose permease